MTIDWTGDKYIGITLDWDYKKQELRTSMPGYVEKALKQFKHILSSNKRQDSPSPFVPPKFGSRKPQMTHRDTSPPLSAKKRSIYNESSENSYIMPERQMKQWVTV